MAAVPDDNSATILHQRINGLAADMGEIKGSLKQMADALVIVEGNK